MKLHSLKSTVAQKSKRLGRGYGSAKGGHTSSRGQKGQNSRNSVPLWFEGGQLPSIRRFPFIRGKRKFTSLTPPTKVIHLNQLVIFKANQVVNIKSLLQEGLISESDILNKRLKILARGTLDKPLTVEVATSKAAQKVIESAGGKVDRGQNS